MNPVQDRDLLWIAKEGLKAPLPEPWKPCRDGSKEIYYVNFVTGESVWEHPCDQYYKQLYQEEKIKKLTNGRMPTSDKQKIGKGSKLPLKLLNLPETRQAEKIRTATEVRFVIYNRNSILNFKGR